MSLVDRTFHSDGASVCPLDRRMPNVLGRVLSICFSLSPMSHKMVHQKFIGSFHRSRVGSGDSWIIPDTAVLCFSLFQRKAAQCWCTMASTSQDPEPFLSTNKFDLVIRRVVPLVGVTVTFLMKNSSHPAMFR